MTPHQRLRIKKKFSDFLAARARNLEALRLADLKFNVVALRTTSSLLEFDTPEGLLRYRLAQHLERGSVTAMGSVLQGVAREISGSASGVAGADIELLKDGRRYYIQVKSGPDTANKDIAQNIGTLLNSARARDPESICVLGVCYARPEQISLIAKAELQNRGVSLKVGREFWEFISGDPNCMAEEVPDIAGEAADGGGGAGPTFAERIDAKVTALSAEFERLYGVTLDDGTWKRFLDANS